MRPDKFFPAIPASPVGAYKEWATCIEEQPSNPMCAKKNKGCFMIV